MAKTTTKKENTQKVKKAEQSEPEINNIKNENNI